MSLVFLSPLVGYTLAAFLNHRIHTSLGQRGPALIGPGCHLLAYIINCTHPPYPVLVISFIFAGFGNGLEDAAWNAWIGNMAHSNELLGLLHGFYGVGAVLSPLAATYMIARANMPWYFFYYIMVSGYHNLKLGNFSHSPCLIDRRRFRRARLLRCLLLEGNRCSLPRDEHQQ